MADKKMTTTAAGRIQGAEAKAHAGKVSSGGFAARAQAAAAKNAVAAPLASGGNKGRKKK
ncbi:MAG TPA: hypothetical protein VFY65_18090 [Longimicrobium sp.]|nr:hypothetical protein [Longimicrobium sp.]